MNKQQKLQQIRDLITGKNLPRPIYYKNQGEPDPPGYRPGIDIMYENVSKEFRIDSNGNPYVVKLVDEPSEPNTSNVLTIEVTNNEIAEKLKKWMNE